ncbi:unnamed protein product [Prorocentrum cordatum]|nr:unnamed protein product [Polarella glacialis]
MVGEYMSVAAAWWAGTTGPRPRGYGAPLIRGWPAQKVSARPHIRGIASRNPDRKGADADVFAARELLQLLLQLLEDLHRGPCLLLSRRGHADRVVGFALSLTTSARARVRGGGSRC